MIIYYTTDFNQIYDKYLPDNVRSKVGSTESWSREEVDTLNQQLTSCIIINHYKHYKHYNNEENSLTYRIDR